MLTGKSATNPHLMKMVQNLY